MTDSITNTDLNKKLQSNNAPLVFDVRKKPAFDSDPRMIENAQWQSHDAVEQWAKELPSESEVVVYCVHGHDVSQNAAKSLNNLGFKATYLEGGIAQWVEAGFMVS